MEGDRELLAGLAGPSAEDALAELIRRYGGMIQRTALRILHDAHLAEDVSQAVFMVLVQRKGRAAGVNALGSWLHHCAVLISLNLRKLEQRRRRREAARAEREEVKRMNIAELPAGFDEALNRLPEIYRQAIVRRFLEGRSCEQAAAELGLSAGLMGVRTARGLEKLRKALAGTTAAISGAALMSALQAEASAATSVPPLAMASAQALI